MVQREDVEQPQDPLVSSGEDADTIEVRMESQKERMCMVTCKPRDQALPGGGYLQTLSYVSE